MGMIRDMADDWRPADTIRKLVEQKAIQPGLFDMLNLTSVTCADDPGERLPVCCNPLVAASGGASATS